MFSCADVWSVNVLSHHILDLGVSVATSLLVKLTSCLLYPMWQISFLLHLRSSYKLCGVKYTVLFLFLFQYPVILIEGGRSKGCRRCIAGSCSKMALPWQRISGVSTRGNRDGVHVPHHNSSLPENSATSWSTTACTPLGLLSTPL